MLWDTMTVCFSICHMLLCLCSACTLPLTVGDQHCLLAEPTRKDGPLWAVYWSSWTITLAGLLVSVLWCFPWGSCLIIRSLECSTCEVLMTKSPLCNKSEEMWFPVMSLPLVFFFVVFCQMMCTHFSRHSGVNSIFFLLPKGKNDCTTLWRRELPLHSFEQ